MLSSDVKDRGAVESMACTACADIPPLGLGLVFGGVWAMLSLAILHLCNCCVKARFVRNSHVDKRLSAERH